MFLEFPYEARFGQDDDYETPDEDADEESEEWQAADAGRPVPFLLEGDRVGFEEEIEEAVD